MRAAGGRKGTFLQKSPLPSPRAPHPSFKKSCRGGWRGAYPRKPFPDRWAPGGVAKKTGKVGIPVFFASFPASFSRAFSAACHFTEKTPFFRSLWAGRRYTVVSLVFFSKAKRSCPCCDSGGEKTFFSLLRKVMSLTLWAFAYPVCRRKRVMARKFRRRTEALPVRCTEQREGEGHMARGRGGGRVCLTPAEFPSLMAAPRRGWGAWATRPGCRAGAAIP